MTCCVDPQFEPVRDVFLANFDQGYEIGAAVSVYQHGKPVVDLAAGVRDPPSVEPYSSGTMQPIFSATKGVTALAANMLADRGQLDLDTPVTFYWPEFAQAGKSEIPVRWLLTHQSGVLGLDQTISYEQLLDWSYVVERLAAQRPDWKPGSKHGYHRITYGFLVGEVIRRIAAQSENMWHARSPDLLARISSSDYPNATISAWLQFSYRASAGISRDWPTRGLTPHAS